MKWFLGCCCSVLVLLLSACERHQDEQDPLFAKVSQGHLKGHLLSQGQVISFKGIPYAAAPLGELRWRAPQAAPAWKGVKSAEDFAHKCMQNPLFSDMQFRASGTSEDCLYLNVWTPLERGSEPLPVLVYFYGGGFIAGDGSEYRYDGANLASQGMVTVTVNYRLGLFGFMAHPALSAESEYGGSGNYGLLDQRAALQWVADNIAAFGGDPTRITLGGESAGSISVTAHLLAKDSIPYIAGAIAESGSIMGRFVRTQQEAEEQGTKLAAALTGGEGDDLAGLRVMPAQQLLNQATEAGFVWFWPSVDGKFFRAKPAELLASQQFAKVPLLSGVNSAEGSYQQLLQDAPPSVDNYLAALKTLYPEHYEQVANLYPADNETQVKSAAQALMSDRFISASTWTFMDALSAVSPAASYYYFYQHIRPPVHDSQADTDKPVAEDYGAVHSAEIEYFLGNLPLNSRHQWQADDYAVSELTQQYLVNFIKSGNPNGAGLVE